jgi:hypothetical protein
MSFDSRVYLTGLLTIRPSTQSLAKKGRRILHPLGPLRLELRRARIALEMPVLKFSRVTSHTVIAQESTSILRQVTRRIMAKATKSAFIGTGLCSKLALRNIEQASFR